MRGSYFVQILESFDGDFLLFFDEYQLEFDGDQSESDFGDQWGIVFGDQWCIVFGDESDIDFEVEWDETDDSELEWIDVKIELGSGLVNMKSKVVLVVFYMLIVFKLSLILDKQFFFGCYIL